MTSVNFDRLLPLLIPLLGYGCFIPSAMARDICESYRNSAPLPDWFSEVCNADGTSKGGPGGAFSSFAAPFNLNPAMIPVFTTPVGFEYIRSFSSGYPSKGNFALLKGQSSFGFAVSSNSDNTIYSNSSSLANRKSSQFGLPTNDNAPSTTSFGAAASFASMFSKETSEWLLPALGILARQNSGTGKYSYGVGSALTMKWLTLSYSVVGDPETPQTPSKTTSTVTTGLKLGGFQLELAYIKSKSDSMTYYYTANGQIFSTILRSTDPDATLLGTLTANLLGLNLTAAARRYQDASLTSYTEFHLAAQWQVSRKISLGYFYNYVPGYQSLALQCML